LKGKMDSERRFFGAEVQTEVLHMLYNWSTSENLVHQDTEQLIILFFLIMMAVILGFCPSTHGVTMRHLLKPIWLDRVLPCVLETYLWLGLSFLPVQWLNTQSTGMQCFSDYCIFSLHPCFVSLDGIVLSGYQSRSNETGAELEGQEVLHHQWVTLW
jgi:hypothetical protein